MLLNILGFFKSGKVIGIALFFIFLIGVGWYISNLRQDVQDMEDQVAVLTNQKATLQTELGRQRQEFQSEIDALNTSLDSYMASLALVKSSNELLTQDLQKVAANDEELEACLSRDLPDSVIQRLLNSN